ncbi:hypothetical protein, partial [Aliarcobacter skirrowii]
VLNFTEARTMKFGDDSNKIEAILKDRKKNYLREYLEKNLESTLKNISDILLEYLRNNSDKILEGKNKEIIEEKKILKKLEEKISNLDKNL